MLSNKDIQNKIEGIDKKYAPDKRVVVFDVKLSEDNSQVTLVGETSCNTAFNLLQDLTMNKLKNKVKLLPSTELGSKTYGIIYNSMGTIHRAANYASETVNQVLMGTPVKILDKKDGWYRIQTPDLYIGWINGSVQAMTLTEQKEYLSKPMLIVTSLYASSYEKPSTATVKVSDLVAGNILNAIDESENFIKTRYADGREAYVLKNDAMMLIDWNPEKTKQGIVSTAMHYIGVPYVWGGTSSKGLDCSGFSKMVYLMHNIILPRDASQQAAVGKLVDNSSNFENLDLGDLVFFGEKATEDFPKERIVHVGIYLGDYRFIHASDYIRINSFNPDDPLYDEFNTSRYIRAKRVLNCESLKSLKGLFLQDEDYKVCKGRIN